MHSVHVQTALVLLTFQAGRLRVATVTENGQAALIRGDVLPEMDEGAHQAAVRVALNLTGLKKIHLHLAQAVVLLKAQRPVALLPYVAYLEEDEAESVAFRLHWLDVAAARKSMSEDDAHVLSMALEDARDWACDAAFPVRDLQDNFTLAELRPIYEAFIGSALNVSRFRRTLLMSGFIEAEEGLMRGALRPGQVYRAVRSKAKARLGKAIRLRGSLSPS